MNVTPKIVVASIRPKPGQRDALVAALREIIPEIHQEDGCLLYALHEGDEDLVFIEKWITPEAQDAHRAGTPLIRLREALKDRVEGPSRVTHLVPVPAGGEQGSL